MENEEKERDKIPPCEKLHEVNFLRVRDRILLAGLGGIVLMAGMGLISLDLVLQGTPFFGIGNWVGGISGVIIGAIAIFIAYKG